MIPIARPLFGAEEEAAVSEVLRSRWVGQGPKVADFERVLGEYVGAPHAVATSSCTTALHLVFAALGIGAGDEVICPSLSFIATANSIVHAGARPVFAEVDERTFNLMPAKLAISPRTKAILLVHQIGLPANIDEFEKIARAHNLHLIEDAACAIGATYHGVRIGGPRGVAACFSFHPRKIISTGEGGMITTRDAALAEKLRRLRTHGAPTEPFDAIGWNYRMSDLQAAVGIVQMKRLDAMLARRRELAARYSAALSDVDTPVVPSDREHAFQSYVIRVRGGRKRRDAIIAQLDAAGVQTRIGLMAAHIQPAYGEGRPSLPVTEALADETLALPLFHELGESDQDRVIESLRAAIR
jgi:dTDP-4-amino-4,6-dideoxygalactose transaminase